MKWSGSIFLVMFLGYFFMALSSAVENLNPVGIFIGFAAVLYAMLIISYLTFRHPNDVLRKEILDNIPVLAMAIITYTFTLVIFPSWKKMFIRPLSLIIGMLVCLAWLRFLEFRIKKF